MSANDSYQEIPSSKDPFELYKSLDFTPPIILELVQVRRKINEISRGEQGAHERAQEEGYQSDY